jgi:hypothetical protein
MFLLIVLIIIIIIIIIIIKDLYVSHAYKYITHLWRNSYDLVCKKIIFFMLYFLYFEFEDIINNSKH